MIFMHSRYTDDQKGNACIVSVIKTQTKANQLVTSHCTIVDYNNVCHWFHLMFASQSNEWGYLNYFESNHLIN
jgi:hypothetical protein